MNGYPGVSSAFSGLILLMLTGKSYLGARLAADAIPLLENDHERLQAVTAALSRRSTWVVEGAIRSCRGMVGIDVNKPLALYLLGSPLTEFVHNYRDRMFAFSLSDSFRTSRRFVFWSDRLILIGIGALLFALAVTPMRFEIVAVYLILQLLIVNISVNTHSRSLSHLGPIPTDATNRIAPMSLFGDQLFVVPVKFGTSLVAMALVLLAANISEFEGRDAWATRVTVIPITIAYCTSVMFPWEFQLARQPGSRNRARRRLNWRWPKRAELLVAMKVIIALGIVVGVFGGLYFVFMKLPQWAKIVCGSVIFAPAIGGMAYHALKQRRQIFAGGIHHSAYFLRLANDCRDLPQIRSPASTTLAEMYTRLGALRTDYGRNRYLESLLNSRTVITRWNQMPVELVLTGYQLELVGRLEARFLGLGDL